MTIALVYFSNYSGNTKRFVEKLSNPATRIPIDKDVEVAVKSEYVLLVPTYGGGSDRNAIPKQVKKFLNKMENRDLLRGVIGFGNTNFGDNYCKAAELIAAKTGVPIIARVEIFGTDNDVRTVQERLALLYDNK
jgi:protein involved in ribonucleotide reduction